MKNAFFWDVAPCTSCFNRPAHASSLLEDFSDLNIEAIRSSETSFKQDLHGVTSQMTTYFNTIFACI
jgi:hypothetical protein